MLQRGPGQAILLDTTEGNPIPNEQARVQTMPLATAALEASVIAPSVMRAPSIPRYNCHGLVFASRRSAIEDDATVYQILGDDRYDPVDAANLLPGDIAVYFSQGGDVEHSAVVVDTEGEFGVRVVSKWGVKGPEVLHRLLDCEYPLGNIRYYRMIR